MLPIKAREVTGELLAGLTDYAFIIDGAMLALRTIPLIKGSQCFVICSESDEILLPEKLQHPVNNDDKKANMTMSILMNALNRNFDVTHDHPIR